MFPCACIPQSDREVPTSAGDSLSIGRIAYTGDTLLMSNGKVKFFASKCVIYPNPNWTCYGKPTAIWRIRYLDYTTFTEQQNLPDLPDNRRAYKARLLSETNCQKNGQVFIVSGLGSLHLMPSQPGLVILRGVLNYNRQVVLVHSEAHPVSEC